MDNIVEHIIAQYKINGNFVKFKPFGNGHINDTYLVTFNQSESQVEYILRKINKYVFKNPHIVVDNTVNVIKHISDKLKEEGKKDITNNVLQLVEARDSKYYYLDKNKDFWCTLIFLKNAYTVEFVETVDQAYQAAKAFGKFQKYLLDAKIDDYGYTIPNFHNLNSRLVAFDQALENNVVNRLSTCQAEIDAINKNRNISDKITNLLKNNELPIRITHNDTKVNNVMLNKETNIGECVIDLDTVMPGTVLYDFGDMVRTSTSPVEEDEKDVSKVFMRIEIFEALVKGYLEELSSHLKEVEIENLIYGAKVIVYEQAVRFLTDYLNGDLYYNTKYEDHNLVRARTQIALLESINEQNNEMEKIVNSYK